MAKVVQTEQSAQTTQPQYFDWVGKQWFCPNTKKTYEVEALDLPNIRQFSVGLGRDDSTLPGFPCECGGCAVMSHRLVHLNK